MKTKFCYLIMIALMAITPLAIIASPSLAKSGSEPQPSTTPLQGSELDADDIESFMDEFFDEQMEALHIPGAAVVVVQDGKIMFSKGYGYADLETQMPVDPERTIMRAGSVSKLVTATAAMQMVENGQMELDSNINQYLSDFQLTDLQYGPVTLHQLLTHTAGFEDNPVGTASLNQDDLLPLGAFLQSNVPQQALRPGEIHSYSNFSLAFAGHLVEKRKYTDQNIFAPLEMSSTSFEQPLPSTLAADLATGYFFNGETYEPGGFLYTQTGPASALSTTAHDMAKFMLAHLQGGSYGGTQVLQSGTASMMQEQQFTHHGSLPGMAYGFKERYINGERVIGHGGDIGTYSSQMILHTEDGWGFYVQYNTFSDALRERLIASFMDRYYPASEDNTLTQTLELSDDELARFAGPYRWVRHSRSTIGKLVALIPGPVNVIIEANNNTLSLKFFGADAEWRFAPTGPMTFTQIEGGVQPIGDLEFDLGSTLVFREDNAGNIDFAFVPLQNVALQKVAWYEGGEAQMGLFGIFLILFLSPFIIWPAGALIGKFRKRKPSHSSNYRRTRSLAAIVSGINFMFMVVPNQLPH